jgi:hypothetical protein
MDPLDRELASLLSVEPSPEFRARVRTRIAGEPSPRSWYLQWRVVACGVVAAAVVIAAVVGRVSLPGNGQRPSRLVIAVPSPRSARAVIHRSSPTGEPEVLVAPRDARGLRQLEALVREGRTHFVFSDEDVPAVSPAPVRDIVIAPIAIAPLEAAALSESAGNSGGDEQ